MAKAGACKALIPGSNPGAASTFFYCREMSERLNVPVLKTGEGNTSGGSNPPLPATYSIYNYQLFYINTLL